MYQKRLVWVGIFAFALLILMAGCSDQSARGELGSSACPTVPTTYYVRQDGNNANTGTANTAGGAWRNINYAVNYTCIKAGDTINVIPGIGNAPYNETVTITKSGIANNRIRLIGNSTGTQAKIAYTGPTKNTWGNAAILLKPANPDSADQTQAYIIGWTITGFRIEGGTDTTRMATTAPASNGPAANGIPYIYDGIAALKAKNITITSNYVFRTGASGIAVRPVITANTVCPNTNDGINYNTICAVQSSGISIIGNTVDTPNVGILSGGQIQLAQEGISLEGVYNFEIYNNTVTNRMKEGIDVKVGGHDGFIRDNTITGPNQIQVGASIYIDGQRAPSYNIDIYRNKVYNSRQNGITISTEAPAYNTSGATSTSGTVVDCNNTCTTATTGIIDVHDITIFDNLVYNNGDATFLGRGITLNSQLRNIEIYHNTFDSNYRAFQFGNSYGGYSSTNITIRNNILSNNGAGGIGYAYNVGIVTFENNLFTGSDIYQLGTNTTGVTPTSNKCTGAAANATGVCSGTGQAAYNKLTTATIYVGTGTTPYQLATTSPALRAGNTALPTVHPNTPAADATKDYAAATRPNPAGTRPDVGAYESPN